MFKIGVFSKMNKVTVKTLRYYDQIGLLKPSYVDQFTGFRYYSANQIPRLHRILALRRIGFSINEVLHAMEQDTTVEQMIAYLEGKQAEIAKTIAEEKARLFQIESYVKMLKQEAHYMSYNMIIKELPEVIVASIRRVIPNYDALNVLFPEMGEYTETQRVKCAVPPYCFTMYHDGEYKESNIDVEICGAVTDFGKDSDQVKFKKLDAVPTAACVIHKGPYTTIGMAYSAIMKWIEENGHEIVGLPRESYIDGKWNKENPEDWISEVQVPVKMKS